MTVVFACANGFEQRVRDAARYRCASHDLGFAGYGHLTLPLCRAGACPRRVQALPILSLRGAKRRGNLCLDYTSTTNYKLYLFKAD